MVCLHLHIYTPHYYSHQLTTTPSPFWLSVTLPWSTPDSQLFQYTHHRWLFQQLASQFHDVFHWFCLPFYLSHSLPTGMQLTLPLPLTVLLPWPWFHAWHILTTTSYLSRLLALLQFPPGTSNLLNLLPSHHLSLPGGLTFPPYSITISWLIIVITPLSRSSFLFPLSYFIELICQNHNPS